MDSFMYYNPTKLLFGKGMINKLEKEITNFGPTILIVYGKKSMKENGIYDQVLQQLKDVKVVELAGVDANPKLDTVKQGMQICVENSVDFILGVGGGSIIDCCKAIAVGAKNGNIFDIIQRKERAKDALPYGSIVTISGTGAEMSISSVISEPKLNQKFVWHSSKSRAKFTIVDPVLMKTVPLKQTLNGIVDSMSHILEHYFHSTENTSIQTEILETMLRRIISDTPKQLADLENDDMRERFAWISTKCLSDQLNMGFIGDWGTHDIAHAIGGKFDIPHGEAISILFPNWMEQAMAYDLKKFKQLALNVLGITEDSKTDVEIAQAGIDKLRGIWTTWGASMNFQSYGIDKEMIEDIPDLMKESNAICGNFYKMDKEDILQILYASL